MKTITLDILEDEALALLKDLESLKIIRLHHKEDEGRELKINRIKSLKGLMTERFLETADLQLSELRGEWL